MSESALTGSTDRTNLEKQQSPASEHPSPDRAASLDESPARTITGLRWFLLCFAIFSANVLYGLDTTIAATIQGAVSDSFDNVTQLGWLGVGFTLGSTAAILPLGKAYSMFDTKWLFIGCLAMFGAASALCGAAPSMNAMIVGRVWAGAAGAGMYLGTLHLVSSTTTPRERAFYNGFIGFVYGGGCILGPIIGGSLADSAATWRWAFYLNLVIFGVMGPVYLFALPNLPQQTDRTWSQKIRKFDWLGIILTASLHACFVIAFTFGGSIWPWNSGRFIAMVALFGAFTAAAAITQRYALFTNASDRLFPCELLEDLQFVLVYFTMACGGAGLFVTVYYIPLLFLFVHGDSGTEAAVRLLPFVCFYVAAILACGYALPRIGYHFVWYLLSGLLLTAGGAAMYVLKLNTPAGYVYGVSVLLGLGLTVSQAGYDVACRTAVAMGREDKIPEVIQFVNIAQGQSQFLGLAIASSIFQSEAFDGMRRVLSGTGFTEKQIQEAISGTRSQVFETITGDLKIRALEVIVHSIGIEWILVMTAGALCTVCALFMPKGRFP